MAALDQVGRMEATAHDFRMLSDKNAQPSVVIVDGRVMQSTPGACARYDVTNARKAPRCVSRVDTLCHLCWL